MTPAGRARTRTNIPVFCVSAIAWATLLAGATGLTLPVLCSTGDGAAFVSVEQVELALLFNPPLSLLGGWLLMLAAMMLPLLPAPLRYVHDRSFARRRVRATALFVAGYAAVWMIVGVVLLAVALAARLTWTQSSLPFVFAATAALVWQISPAKQRCLNRCHHRGELSAFGLGADLDALTFGARHGLWCAGSCWALMLVPLMAPSGHLVIMALVTLWLFAERLERPTAPGWSWRGPGKTARAALARLRTQLQPMEHSDEARYPRL